MKRQWLLVASVLAGLAIIGWGITRYAPPPEGVVIGRTAPDYRVVQLTTGDSVGVRSANSGHVTLINVWATWCAPCRAEMPSMQRIYTALAPRGFRIAAVSVDAGDAQPVRDFATELKLTFDIFHDASGGIQQSYRMVGVPQSFLLDRRGVVRYVSLGSEVWDSPANRARIEALLVEE